MSTFANLKHSLSNKFTLYHYTTMDIAINEILENQVLKLQLIEKTNDPIGHMVHFQSLSFTKTNVDIPEGYSFHEVQRLANRVFKAAKKPRALSFCMNHVHPLRYTSYEGKKEFFGFMKSSMWSRCADQFKGVCIAFKPTLIKNDDPQFEIDFNAQAIKYIKHDQIKNKLFGIDTRFLETNRHGKFRKALKKQVEDLQFYKHIDYEKENEFKILARSGRTTLPIDNQIEAVFVFKNTLADHHKEQLEYYSIQYKFDIYYLEIGIEGIEI